MRLSRWWVTVLTTMTIYTVEVPVTLIVTRELTNQIRSAFLAGSSTNLRWVRNHMTVTTRFSQKSKTTSYLEALKGKEMKEQTATTKNSSWMWMKSHRIVNVLVAVISLLRARHRSKALRVQLQLENNPRFCKESSRALSKVQALLLYNNEQLLKWKPIYLSVSWGFGVLGCCFNIEIRLKYEKIILLFSSRAFSLSTPMENSAVCQLRAFSLSTPTFSLSTPTFSLPTPLDNSEATKCNKNFTSSNIWRFPEPPLRISFVTVHLECQWFQTKWFNLTANF